MEHRYLPPIVSKRGLVCSLTMNQGLTTGAIIFDESGGGFDGTATNSPVPVYPGFDFTAASNMFIEVGTGPTTVSSSMIWVKQDDVAGTEATYRINSSDRVSVVSGVVTLTGFAGGTVLLYVDGVLGTAGVTTITAGVFHHIAVTDTSAKDADAIRLARVTVGQYSDGVFGDFLLYDRVLAADEVAAIFHAQRRRYAV